MSNYVVSDTNLTAVANAIRTKGGTSEQLEFPDDFVSAIGNIQTGGGTVGLHPDTLANLSGNSWSGYVDENNRIIDALAPSTSTNAYIGFTGFTELTLNATVEIVLKVFSTNIPKSLRVYVATNRGSMDLGTHTPSDGVFTFTGTNNNWRRDICGLYIQNRSSGTLQPWSCTVSLSVNGTVIF